MSIKSIAIRNVKGIKNKTFQLNLIPNKPSILVAPNGFGKTSFSTAFNSLNTKRLALDEDDLHEGDDSNTPVLTIDFLRADGTNILLVADNASNSIVDELDWFVINSQLVAKGIRQTFGGRTSVSASLSVKPISLIDKIPENVSFNYSVATQRELFGVNGKVLTNIGALFNIPLFIELVNDNFILLDRCLTYKYEQQIEQLVADVNAQTGTSAALIAWIEIHKLVDLEAIAPLHTLADLIINLDATTNNRIESFLATWQLINLYKADKKNFKKACKFKLYEFEKRRYVSLFGAFNSTWKRIRPIEKDGSLILEFPKAHHISNGQRDVLSFVALLHKAQRKLKKDNCVLVIDEIFDYLDDANLISAQYFVSQLIDEYIASGRKLYPIILTHLNPGYFRNYTFSKQKVYYLDQSTATVNASLIKLLTKREEPTIDTDVSKYLFHYHTGHINKRAEFQALGLRETWGENNNFDNYINAELTKYINNQPNYDPFAICCGVRKKIEFLIYSQLADPVNQQTFLNTHKTRSKLEFAESQGVTIPETYYLLGIIYNDGMHWKQNQDNVSPIVSKLENITIRKLITDILSA